MPSPIRFLLSKLLSSTPLGRWPVRVRKGVAKGARWTMYPWMSYWRGTHEPVVQGYIMRLCDAGVRNWACWDLGAHFGVYSVGLAIRVGPTGQVVAFEPNPVSFDRLRLHREINRLSWLKLYPAAASDANREVELYTYGNLGSTTTHLPYENESRTQDVGAITVRAMRLDDLVESGDVRLPQLVKIDVEGHGHRALSGMRGSLQTAKPIIVMAIHSPAERAGALSILAPMGYQMETLEEIGDTGDYAFVARRH